MLLLFPDYLEAGKRLANELSQPYELIDIHRFPDGESRVTLPPLKQKAITICCSLDHPNNKLIELLLVVETAREMGVEEITLVAPYLCYLRQDIAFHPGEAVSGRIISRLLARLFERVITVDPHLHRISQLSDVMPNCRAESLASAELMGEFLQQKCQCPLLIGPDAESEQWVRAIAEPAGLDFAVALKERLGDREVRIKLPDHNYHQHEVVLVDDMISTGRTLINVTRQLKAQGAETIHCLVTHALFSDDVTRQLHEAGISQIWSSDSINHASNALSLTPLLVNTLKR